LYARQLLRSGFANTVVNQISQAAKISHIHLPPPPPPPHLDPLNIFPLLADRPAHRGNTLERISHYSRFVVNHTFKDKYYFSSIELEEKKYTDVPKLRVISNKKRLEHGKKY
ncbi:MAG: hypothetical protein ACK559_34705, partial [bacterium]